MRLATIGAELLLETLPDYVTGKIIPQPQNDDLATYAGMIKKEEGLLDLTVDAAYLERQVRAFSPWPSAFILWQGEPLKIHRAHVAAGMAETGKRSVIHKMPAIGTITGWLVLDEVQPAGKKAMPGQVFLNGARNWSEEA
jgi:methionyl-tRNA formyltransferase